MGTARKELLEEEQLEGGAGRLCVEVSETGRS